MLQLGHGVERIRQLAHYDLQGGMMGRRRKTQTYLTSDEIYSEWRKWKDTGVVSDEMARQM